MISGLCCTIFSSIPLGIPKVKIISSVFFLADRHLNMCRPIDAAKTIMQVEGKGGFEKLVKKTRVGGPTVLFHGALAAAGATCAKSPQEFRGFCL